MRPLLHLSLSLLSVAADVTVDLDTSLSKTEKINDNDYINLSTKVAILDAVLEDEKTNRRTPVGNKTAALGSQGRIYRNKHSKISKGFFSTILAAYANHWPLVTTPEDWWYTIIRRVALAIDENATNQKVRDFFVSHKGKKKLVVEAGPSIYSTDYNWFFDQMVVEVANNIKKPEYVDIIQPDFGSTAPHHRLVANVAIMSSLQEYFQYGLSVTCGIPRVTMKGSREDWSKLKTKFQDLRTLLEPIRNETGGRHNWDVWHGFEDDRVTNWWDTVEEVIEHLEDTYDNKPNLTWWKSILFEGHSGGCDGGKEFNGWFMYDFLGHRFGAEDEVGGLVSVPLTLTDGGLEEEAAVVAGMAGYHLEEDRDWGWTVEASHDWALMVEMDSHFRQELNEWESNLVEPLEPAPHTVKPQRTRTSTESKPQEDRTSTRPKIQGILTENPSNPQDHRYTFQPNPRRSRPHPTG